MGLIKTDLEKLKKEEMHLEHITSSLNFYKGYAEALRMVIKLLLNKDGK